MSSLWAWAATVRRSSPRRGAHAGFALARASLTSVSTWSAGDGGGAARTWDCVVGGAVVVVAAAWVVGGVDGGASADVVVAALEGGLDSELPSDSVADDGDDGAVALVDTPGGPASPAVGEPDARSLVSTRSPVAASVTAAAAIGTRHAAASTARRRRSDGGGASRYERPPAMGCTVPSAPPTVRFLPPRCPVTRLHDRRPSGQRPDRLDR